MKLTIQSLRHFFGYWLYRSSVLLVGPVPLTTLFLCGKCLGLAAYFALRKRRVTALRNIRSALDLDEPKARILARQHFTNLGANVLCMLKVPTMSDATIWRHVTFAIAPEISREPDGRGWVAVLSHMSNWELLAVLTRLFPQYRFGAIYQKLANRQVDDHFNKARARMGISLFDRSEGFWNSVAFLESGGVVGVLADQYAGDSGTWMPFFRRLTSTSTLPAALAGRVGVDIVPIAVTTTGLARWHVSVGNPLKTGQTPEDTTAVINRELERQITAAPADWLWTHDRWKTPRFGFLLSASRRRAFFPPDFDRSHLIPYQVLVRSVDDPEEAKLTVGAVRAIKHGRPDARVTVVAENLLEEFWRELAEVDEIIAFHPGQSPLQVAKLIAQSGRYDVGILLSNNRRGALEMFWAGVPHRLGPPGRYVLNTWQNPPGMESPPPTGTERYRRIVEAAGAALQPFP